MLGRGKIDAHSCFSMHLMGTRLHCELEPVKVVGV